MPPGKSFIYDYVTTVDGITTCNLAAHGYPFKDKQGNEEICATKWRNVGNTATAAIVSHAEDKHKFTKKMHDASKNPANNPIPGQQNIMTRMQLAGAASCDYSAVATQAQNELYFL